MLLSLGLSISQHGINSAKPYASIAMTPNRPVPGEGDSILYVLTVSGHPDAGSVRITQSGDLTDADFDKGLQAALVDAAAGKAGVTIGANGLVSFTSAFDGVLSFPRTITGAPAVQSTHTIQISEPVGVQLYIYAATLAIAADIPIPTPSGSVPGGVNLSSAEFGGSGSELDVGYTYPKPAELDYYYARGMRYFRIPFKWGRVQPSIGGALSTEDTARLVALCTKAQTLPGAVVILDCHDYGQRGNLKVNDASIPSGSLADMWIKLMAAVRPTGANVRVGLMNEPKGGTPTPLFDALEWSDYAKTEIAAMRTGGVTERIMVPGSFWTGAHSWVSSGNAAAWAGQLPANCYLEMHQYLDSDSSGTHFGDNDATPGAGASRLQAATTWLRAQGYKAGLYEFGFTSAPAFMAEAQALLTFMEQNADVWESWTVWTGGPWWSATYPYLVAPINGIANPEDRPQMRLLMDHTIPIASNSAPTDISLSNSASSSIAVQGDLVGNLSAFDPNGEDFHRFLLVDSAADRFQIIGSQLQIGSAGRVSGETHSIIIRATDRAGAFVDRTFSMPVLPAPNVLFTRTTSFQVNEGQNHVIRTTVSSVVPGSGFDIWHGAPDAAQFNGTWESVVRAAFEPKGYTVTPLHPTKMQIRMRPESVAGNIDITWQTKADLTTEGAPYQANFFIDNAKGLTLNTNKTSLTAAALIADTSVTAGWSVSMSPGSVLPGGTVVHTIALTGGANGMSVQVDATGTATDANFDVPFETALAAAVASETGLSYNASTNVLSRTGAWDGVVTFSRQSINESASALTYGIALSNPVSSGIGTGAAEVTLRAQAAAVISKTVDYAGGETTDTVYQDRPQTALYRNAAGVYSSVAPNAMRTGDQGLLLEPDVTNLLMNPLGVGNPDGWLLPAGMTKAGAGYDNGLAYVDLRWQRAAFTGSVELWLAGSTEALVALNQQYTFSYGMKIVGGSHDGFDYILNSLKGRNASGGSVQSLVGRETSVGVNRVWYKTTKTFTSSTVVYGLPSIAFHGNGTAAIDVTFRIYAPMLQLGGARTIPVLPAAGVKGQATKAADKVVILYTPPAEGNFLLDFDCIDRPYTPGQVLVSLYKDDANYIELSYGTGGGLRLQAVVNGVTTAAIEGGFVTPGFQHKAAFRYAQNDFALILDANVIGVATTGNVPPITNMALGRDRNTQNNAGLRVRKWISRNDLRADQTLIAETVKTGVALSPGVNMAGAEFGTAFYPDNSNLSYYAGKGIRHIRYPMRWERLQPALFGPLNSTIVDSMKAYLADCAANNLVVIFDLHNYGKYPNGVDPVGSVNVPISALVDFWTRFATEMVGRAGLWGYDLMNEPSGMLPDVKTVMQAVINGIRTVDVTAAIFVEGSASSGAYNWGLYNDRLIVNDPSNNLWYSPHAYFDNDRSGLYDQSTDYVNRQWAYDSIIPVLNFATANGFRLLFGESGWPGISTNDRYNDNGDIFAKGVHEHGHAFSYWAGGEHWSNSYSLNIEPANGVDKPQMAILQRHVRPPPAVVAPDPVIVLSGSSLSEGAAAGTAIGTLSVLNGSGAYTFSLLDNAGNRFALTGAALKAGATATDFETASSHSILVSATNGVDAEIQQPFTILVGDVNENTAPQFTTPAKVAGTAQVGETVTGTPGTATGAPVPTRTYRFLLDNTAIATGVLSYVLQAADAGKTLAFEDTATNVAGTVASKATLGVVAAAPVTPPTTAYDEIPWTPDMAGLRAVFDTSRPQDILASDLTTQAVAGDEVWRFKNTLATTTRATSSYPGGDPLDLRPAGSGGPNTTTGLPPAGASANAPILGLPGTASNGYLPICFRGGAKRLETMLGAFSPSVRYTAFVFGRFRGTGSRGLLAASDSSTAAIVVQSSSTAPRQFVAGTGGTGVIGTYADEEMHMISVERPAGSAQVFGRKDGAETQSPSGGTSNVVNASFIVGNLRDGTTAGADADIFFVAFAEGSALSSSLPMSRQNLRRLEGYCAHRFQGAGALNCLPADHIYKNNPPTVPTGTTSTAAAFEGDTVNLAQTWIGSINELQVDSYYGSGYPATDATSEKWGIPWSLTTDERARLKAELFNTTGPMFVKIPAGFAYRGFRNIDPVTGVAKNIGERWSGQNAVVTDMISNLIPRGGGILWMYWSPAPHWKTNKLYRYNSTGQSGYLASAPNSTTPLSTLRAAALAYGASGYLADPYWAQIDAYTDAIKDDFSYVWNNIGPIRIFGLQNEASNEATAAYGHCYYDDPQMYADILKILIPKLRALEGTLPTYGGFPNAIKIVADDWWGFANYAGAAVANDPSVLPTGKTLLQEMYASAFHDITLMSADADYARTSVNSKYTVAVRRGLPCFDGEFEYFTTTNPVDWRFANTAMVMMKTFEFMGAPTFSGILHVGKPILSIVGGTSSANRGYANVAFRVPGVDQAPNTQNDPFPNCGYGEFEEIPENFNAMHWAWEFMPEGSRRAPMNYTSTAGYTVDQSVIEWIHPDGSLCVAVVNRATTAYACQIGLPAAMTMYGYLWDHLGNGVVGNRKTSLGVKAGSVMNLNVAPRTVQVWKQGAAVSGSTPGAISNLSVSSVTASSVQLAFTNATGATSHQVAISTNGGSSFGAWATLASDKNVTVLSPSTAYVFKVRGANSVGYGPASNNVSATTAAAADTTAPTITSSASVSLAENAALSHSLTANETVTWAIVGGADQALFSLAGSTLSMAAKNFEAPADADANNVYVVQVRATDTAGNQTTQTINVTVTDVAEGDTTAPTITSTGSHTVAENASYSATATANETVTWAKGGTDAALVTLNTSTGVWSVLAQNYESRTSIVFTLTATDTAGNASAPQTVTLAITNVNESPTDIALSANSFSEGAAEGTLIGTLTGTDPDAGASITFSLTDSASGKVKIASGNQLQVGASAAAAGSFSITVQATDGVTTPYTESFTIVCIGADTGDVPFVMIAPRAGL